MFVLNSTYYFAFTLPSVFPDCEKTKSQKLVFELGDPFEKRTQEAKNIFSREDSTIDTPMLFHILNYSTHTVDCPPNLFL